jgi:exodeoxyribonuclease V gamma subunit
LENEIALVQSNGIAQWLKLAWPKTRWRMTWAAAASAAIDVQLPGSFMWQLYRSVLGRAKFPKCRCSTRLTWRLMRLLRSSSARISSPAALPHR